ncbi:MAG TPA: HypC/HybG/HupF family hydrogenase formation chaperone [Balneolales bacterium]|nr:HypC/HybG/HupF family hydrogenase formation chaperone [Balneolales bacterium]
MCLGIPGKIVEINHQENKENELLMGKVSFGGLKKEVCLSYVPNAIIGDYVIVHVGFAISILDKQEARQVFDYLEELDQ